MTLSGNTPLLLDDPGSAWMCTSGVLDIFFVLVDGGRPSGPRYHCTTVEPGEVFFMPAVPERFGLLAVSSGESRLRRVDFSAFQALGNAAGKRVEFAALLDTWIGGLVEGAVSEEVKFTDLEVEAGMELVIGREASARTRGPVVWVEVPADQVVYMDRRVLGHSSERVWVPLSGRGWIWMLASESFTLRTCSTADMLGHSDFWHWVDDFCPVFFACAQQRVLVLDSEERQRLRQLHENNQWAQQEALDRMQNVLTGSKMPDDGGADPRDDLLAACSLVGQALGMTIRPPLEPANTGLPPAVRVERIARVSGIRVRQVLLEDRWWCRDHGPLLAFSAASGNPVALLPLSPSRYVLRAPCSGESVVVTAAVARSMALHAYVFYRSLPGHATAARELLSFGLRGSGRDFLTLGVMGTLAALLGLLPPLLTGYVFNTVIPQAEHSLLFQVTLGLLAVAIGTITFELTKVTALLRICARGNHAVENAVWDRLLKLPVGFFRRFAAGDLALRAMGFSEMHKMLKGPATIAVLSGIFTSVNLVLMFYYSTKLTLIGLLLIVLAGIFLFFVCRSLSSYSRSVLNYTGELGGMVFQFMAGIGKLRSAGAEVRAYSRWARLFSEQMHTQNTARLYGICQTIFSTVYPGVSTLVLFLSLGVFMKDDSSLSIGDFLAFNASFGALLSAVLAMNTSLVSFVAILFIYERAAPILESLPEVDETRAFPGRLNGRIEVNQVSFRYDKQGPFILDRVTLQVKPGEMIAVVGPSGSGKSTLVRLLLGFETPETGAIFYDGQDLSRLESQSVRRQMGVVLQNGSILPGSIYQNIAGGTPLSLDEAWQAARLAGIEQDIREMPMQMHTRIMEGAGGFSGGQRQRLLIARAVAGNPRILIFDEATSALDNLTQELVSKSIEGLRATRIVIAHRLSTIRRADRIYVMAGGRIVEEGTHDELMRREGPFYELVARQII